MFEPRHANLGKRIDMHQLAAIAFRLLQCSQHARMIRSRILSDDEDCLGKFEVFERHRSLAYANCFAQRRSARLVAHVRAVRKIIGAELPHEKLIKESGFIARPSGGVKNCFVGVVQ